MTWPATQGERERVRETRDKALSDRDTVIVNDGFHSGSHD